MSANGCDAKNTEDEIIKETLKGFKSKYDNQPNPSNPEDSVRDNLTKLAAALHAGKITRETFDYLYDSAHNPMMKVAWHWYGVKCTEEEFEELEKKYKDLTNKTKN